MKFRSLALLGCLISSIFLAFSSTSVEAAVEYDIEGVDAYNAVVGGSQAGTRLGRYNVGFGNFDNDGKDDLVLTDYSSPHDIYVVLGSQFDGSYEQLLDTAEVSDYFLRYSPPNTSEFNAYYTAYGADLDNNGTDELIIANDNATVGGTAGRGAVYIMYDSLLSSYSGTGNNVSLGTSTNWNLRLAGASLDDWFGVSVYAESDLNLDGKPDLVISAPYTDYTDTDAGSGYVIYSSLLNTYSGTTGTTLSMSDTASYHLRADGPLAGGGIIAFAFGETYDYDNDNQDDLILMASATDFSEAGSGSYYLISNTLLAAYTGTGNVLDLSDTNDFSLRFDSQEAGSSVGFSLVSMGDVNNNGKTDLVFTASYASNAPYTGDGSIFIIYDEIFEGEVGTGNTLSLVDTSNFTMKYTGLGTDVALGESTWLGDYTNDGKLDLITHDLNNVYVLDNELLSSYVGTGTSEILGPTDNYSFKFVKGVNDINTSFTLADFNGDGSKDFVIYAWDETFLTRANADTNYVVFNFPHSLSLNSSQHQFSGNTATLRGTVTSSNSILLPAGMQYLVDAQNPDNPGWASCSATDGSFDAATEDFTCQVSNLTAGAHTIYMRALDDKSTYTPVSGYASVVVNVSSSGNTTFTVSNTAQPPNCAYFKPAAAPELFQINTTQNSATLYFVPVVGNTNSYFIRFGSNQQQLEHGDEFFETASQGVIVRKINHLAPQTEYYFQVRAGNNCMPGEWGNTLKATTTSGVSRIKQFYLYLTKPLVAKT